MKKLLASLFVAISLAAVAQSVPADRPGQTMSATTAQKCTWVIQVGPNFGGFVDKKNGKAFDSWGFPLDVRYGITDKFEIMVAGSANFASTQGTGAGIEYNLLSYAAFGRFNLFDETTFGSLAFLAGYERLSYEGGIAGADNFVAKALYKLPLGEKFTLASNLGYIQTNVNKLDYTEEDGGSFIYTVALSFMLQDNFGLFLETYGSQGSRQSAWIDAGIFWLPRTSVQWDVNFGNGGIDSFSNYYATIGVCFQLGKSR